jgi:predicted metal-dependent TIM-barrel fold hydrolase
MSKLKIERIGGLAGFGTKNSHLRSIGEIDTDDLSKEDKNTIIDLFESQSNMDITPAIDTFRYKISRVTDKGIDSIEVNEEKIPATVRQFLNDKII